MNQARGRRRRDPVAWLELLDPWARQFLGELRADPWGWHARSVVSGEVGSAQAASVGYGLAAWERAAVRSLYWCNSHAASSGAAIHPDWSLEVSWLAPSERDGLRRRMLLARVMPREAGRRYYAQRARPGG